jgi:hypothetical protein
MLVENKDPNWLATYSKGRAAEYGEGEILKKISNTIGGNDIKWFVEFGAGNGLSASNSRSFITEMNYAAVLIEPMNARYQALSKLYEEYKNVITLNNFVGFEGEDRLDNLLSDTDIPKNFDILSIDIDGNDYHVWAALKNYSPKVVCIEFNETVPPHIDFVQNAKVSVNQGCGILPLCTLGKAKGYELVCVSDNNAFFVLEQYYHLFNITDNSPSLMYSNTDKLTYLFVGYDGEIFLAGSKRLHWHSMDINADKLQQLPKLARKFPPNYNFFERFLFRLWRFKNSPGLFIKSILLRK